MDCSLLGRRQTDPNYFTTVCTTMLELAEGIEEEELQYRLTVAHPSQVRPSLCFNPGTGERSIDIPLPAHGPVSHPASVRLASLSPQTHNV